MGFCLKWAFTFILAVLLVSTALADVRLGISERLLAVSGKSQSDGSKGNLLSVFTPELSSSVWANINSRLNIFLGGDLTLSQFKAPSNRSISNTSLTLKNYYFGVSHKFTDSTFLNYSLGFLDLLSYHAKTQSEVVIDKSSGAFVEVALTHLLNIDYITSYQLSAKLLSPIVSEYDEGNWGYGYGVLVQKDFTREGFDYHFFMGVNFANLPMKKTQFSNTDFKIGLQLNIPIRLKEMR